MATTVDFVHAYTAVNNSGLLVLVEKIGSNGGMAYIKMNCVDTL